MGSRVSSRFWLLLIVGIDESALVSRESTTAREEQYPRWETRCRVELKHATGKYLFRRTGWNKLREWVLHGSRRGMTEKLGVIMERVPSIQCDERTKT